VLALRVAVRQIRKSSQWVLSPVLKTKLCAVTGKVRPKLANTWVQGVKNSNNWMTQLWTGCARIHVELLCFSSIFSELAYYATFKHMWRGNRFACHWRIRLGNYL
jgi:hypothetical protein